MNPVEDLEEFMAALERTGAFSGVLPRSDQPDESGQLHSELQAYYSPSTAAAPAPASDSGKGDASSTPGNVSGEPAAPKPSAKADPR